MKKEIIGEIVLQTGKSIWHCTVCGATLEEDLPPSVNVEDFAQQELARGFSEKKIAFFNEHQECLKEPS